MDSIATMVFLKSTGEKVYDMGGAHAYVLDQVERVKGITRDQIYFIELNNTKRKVSRAYHYIDGVKAVYPKKMRKDDYVF